MYTHSQVSAKHPPQTLSNGSIHACSAPDVGCVIRARSPGRKAALMPTVAADVEAIDEWMAIEAENEKEGIK